MDLYFSISFATANEVSYLVLPPTLITDIPLLLSWVSTLLETTPSPPTIYTVLTPERESKVAYGIELVWVNKIGAFMVPLNPLADNPSTKASPFTKIALS